MDLHSRRISSSIRSFAHSQGRVFRSPIARFLLILCLGFAASGTVLAQTQGDRIAALEKQVADAKTAVVSAQTAGDNAWMLVSAALVLMMSGPGLALFYGGLVRKKNILGTMM